MSIADYNDDNVPKSSVFIFQLPFHSFLNLLFIKFTIHSCGILLCFIIAFSQNDTFLCCLTLRYNIFKKQQGFRFILFFFYTTIKVSYSYLSRKTRIFFKVQFQNIMYNHYITEDFRCFALHI